MAKRKTKLLTMAEHAELGQRLYRLRAESMAIARELGEVYPKTSKSVRTAQKLYRVIDALRCEMDNRVFREHPVEASTRVYYGGETETVTELQQIEIE